MSLSERIRPHSEAAPWVIEEVKKLESYLEVMKINWEHQKDRAEKAEQELALMEPELEAMTSLAKSIPSIGSAHERMERAEARLAAAKETISAYEPLLGKAAEAMGFIRFAAISWGLAGESWSEEPGFGAKMTEAMMKRERQLAAERARVQKLEDGIKSILPKPPYHPDLEPEWIYLNELVNKEDRAP